MRIGVELEYWVTDSEGKLTSSKEITEKLDFAEQEFVEPLVEVKTQPNEDFEELKEEIIHKLKRLVGMAEHLNQKIVPLGTPLNSRHIEKLHSERGEIQEQIIGEDLEAARRVAGTHIHFEKKEVKDQLNSLTALDPALALINSSPYYQGEKIASSSRNQVYRYRCYKKLPQHGQLWNYVKSVDEWEDRMSQAFEKFLQLGKEEGVLAENINENFSLENALWTPVRLRKDFPTVEWRAPDVGRLQDTLRLIKQVKQIMGAGGTSKPPFKDLEELSEKAITEGLQNEHVKNYLKKCGFSVEEYRPLSSELDNGESLSLEKAKRVRLSVAQDFSQALNAY